MRLRLGKMVNWALAPLGLALVRRGRARPWDAQFREWIAEAQAARSDPNDFADAQWGGNPLPFATEARRL